MDVYSCGVLLFVLLVGRKPWDDDDSATLAYAVKRTADAPGLRDRRFRALSRDAQALLRWMLADLARERPTAAEVVAHPWLRRDPASAAARRLLSRQVQRRMCALADSRRLLGARRALLLMPSGSQSAAEAFHRAVAEARRLKAEAAAAAAAQRQAQVVATAAAAASSSPAASATTTNSSNSGGVLEDGVRASGDERPPSAAPLPSSEQEDGRQQSQQQQQQQEHPDGAADTLAAAPQRPPAARKSARSSSALAAAIAGHAPTSAVSLAELAAGASVADLARVSLARQSRVGAAPPAGGGLAKKSVGVGARGNGSGHPASGNEQRAVRDAQQQEAAEASASSPQDEGTSERPLVHVAALDHGISLPTALLPAQRRGWGGRVAVSCSPGALQLVAAAEHARHQALAVQGRLTTEDDDDGDGDANDPGAAGAAADTAGVAAAAAAASPSSSLGLGATPAGLGALGLGTPASEAGRRRSGGGGRRGGWTPTSAAAELLASFRQRRGGALLRPLNASGRRSLERTRAAAAAAAALGASPLSAQRRSGGMAGILSAAARRGTPPQWPHRRSPGAFAAVAGRTDSAGDADAPPSPSASVARRLSYAAGSARFASADLDLALLLDGHHPDSGGGAAAADGGSAAAPPPRVRCSLDLRLPPPVLQTHATSRQTPPPPSLSPPPPHRQQQRPQPKPQQDEAPARGPMTRLDSAAMSEEGLGLPSCLLWPQHPSQSAGDEADCGATPLLAPAGTQEGERSDDAGEALYGAACTDDCEDACSPGPSAGGAQPLLAADAAPAGLLTVDEAADEEEREAAQCSCGGGASGGGGGSGGGGDAVCRSRTCSDGQAGASPAKPASAAAAGTARPAGAGSTPASAVDIWRRWGRGGGSGGGGRTAAPSAAAQDDNESAGDDDDDDGGAGEGVAAAGGAGASKFCVGTFRGFGAAGALLRGSALGNQSSDEEGLLAAAAAAVSDAAGAFGVAPRPPPAGRYGARPRKARPPLAEAGSSGDASSLGGSGGGGGGGDGGASGRVATSSVDALLEEQLSGLPAPPERAPRFAAPAAGARHEGPGNTIPAGPAARPAAAPGRAAAATKPPSLAAWGAHLTLHAVGGGDASDAEAAAGCGDGDNDDDDAFDGPSALLL